MPSMRLLFLAAGAFLVVLLWGEWLTFSREHARNKKAAPDRVMEPAPADENASVLPDITLSATNAPATQSHDAEKIRIVTDVLHLTIDLRGGDVVGVSLPRYPQTQEPDSDPFVLLEQEAGRIYIAQSGLIGEHGVDREAKRSVYRSEKEYYQLPEEGEKLEVVLFLDAPGQVRIRKIFTFARGDYLVRVDHVIENGGPAIFSANLFAQIRRGDFSAQAEGGWGRGTFLGAAVYTPEKPYTRLKFKKLKKKTFERNVAGGWIGIVQHYFLSAWIPEESKKHNYFAKESRDSFYAGFVDEATRVPPGESARLRLAFYAGPKDQKYLKTVSPGLDLTIDYGWLWWLAQPLFFLLLWFFNLTQNWGVAIILLTFLIKFLFYPLSNFSYRSMARMRTIQPLITELRERFPDDRQAQAQELTKLYREKKIQPLGGCLPILVQMPVFLALYWVLLESVELRHAPFALWIQDLSQPDPFFVLPLLMGGTMFLQQKLNPTPPDPVQAKIMAWLPAVFTVFFMFFPAGLVLYWLVNSMLSVLQQWVITRRLEMAEGAA